MLERNCRMVVLDDDPTGIQTVHGCLLLTQWSEQLLRTAFSHEQPFFYILTNTRAMTRQKAAEVVADVMRQVIRANRDFGYRLFFVSRSDSCLRGHFPLETDVMQRVLREHRVDVWPKIPFCPAFIEAGRVTCQGVHYMLSDGKRIPIAQTEFARDNVFGYTSSRLSDYIREKGDDPDRYVIVDAESYGQLHDFCRSLVRQTAHFHGAVVIRSSSSLPKALSGIADQPLLSGGMLRSRQGVGCFVVGSHVQKTTRQLQCLLQAEGTEGVEVDVERILSSPDRLLDELSPRLAAMAKRGITPVVYTSRRELRLDDADQRQQLGQRVSDFLVQVVRRLPFTPAYLVAKGGITSHDILTKALDIKTATVMGQIVESVPCVMAERFPYVIFPGNVGNDRSLREIYEKAQAAGC